MSAVTRRSICQVTRHAARSTMNGPIIPHLPGHSHIPAHRSLNAAASSSSLSSAVVQAGNMNADQDACIELSSFKVLAGRINHDTLKALMVHPFQVEALNFVQGRVAALLPDLVRPWDPDKFGFSNVPSPISPDRNPQVNLRDILVRARTGTGKTFAYIIPAIESRLNYVEHHASLAVINSDPESCSRVADGAKRAYRHRTAGPLILVPTRELAVQIASDAQKLTVHHKNFEVQLLVGGAGKARQIEDWTESAHDLVVATPGRFRDLLTNEPKFRQGFKDCPLLILDEADILLSTGFRDDIDAIVSFLPRPPARQTFLFSTTMSRAVRQLASWILSPDHMFINAVPPEPTLDPGRNEKHTNTVSCDDEYMTRDRIELFHTLCPTPSDQLPALLKLLTHDQLSHGSGSKVIVLCPTVQMTELFSTLLRSLVEKLLPDDTIEILTVHSKMEKADRDRTQALFHKAGKTQNGRPTVLVSSDVSTRGVDYFGVTRIIQIGVPSKESIYIHRIGRMVRGVGSFVPRQGKEDSRPMVRADLLLLPWEARYMDWQLTSLPMKSLAISALDHQLASLSRQSSTLTTESVKSALAGILRRIESTDIRNAAASLLGYYLPLTPSLRLQPSAVLTGVSAWASECFGVSIPMLTRLPRKFTEAYAQSTQSKTKGLFVDGLKVAGASPLGKAKFKNRSIWEGGDSRKKPRRWY